MCDYINQLNKFNNLIHERQYIFELTKCCNYKEWILIYKNYSCMDFFRNVKEQMQNNNIKLFVKDEFDNVLFINESNLSVKQLILSNPHFFKPIYPLPHSVVYRVFVDDGHTHSEHSDSSDQAII